MIWRTVVDLETSLSGLALPQSLPDLSLVICTLDESAAIGRVLDEVRTQLAGVDFEILVVDDSTDDLTKDAVLAATVDDSRVRIISRGGPRGLASAAIEGWEAASGGVLGVMDGDGQHDPRLIPTMLKQIHDGSDLAVASRFAPDATLGLEGLRRLISNAGTALVQLVAGAATTDPLSGFFLMKRATFYAARPKLTGLGFKILVDVLMANPRRLQIAEVPTSLRARQGGESKLDVRVMIELLAQLAERRSGGLVRARFLMFAGVGVSGLAVHATALGLLGQIAPLALSQALAILAAMAWNYCLNNLLTFRDMRLEGAHFWRGLVAFALACTFGSMISEMVAIGLQSLGTAWLTAGMGGALAAAIFNYLGASRAAWRLLPDIKAKNKTVGFTSATT